MFGFILISSLNKQTICTTFSGWCFQLLFISHPENWGRFPLWLFFFQRGWFNHQLVFVPIRCVQSPPVPGMQLCDRHTSVSNPELNLNLAIQDLGFGTCVDPIHLTSMWQYFFSISKLPRCICKINLDDSWSISRLAFGRFSYDWKDSQAQTLIVWYIYLHVP